jgi:hypothetical protein
MPDYDAYEFFGRHPSERFPGWALGLNAWREFGNGIPDTLRPILDSLITSRRSANWGAPPLKCPRLFVSHKKEDEKRAREIYDLARQMGWNVWLDVLEPALQFPLRAPTVEDESRAVAAIIEMALLNCTHVLAVLTTLAERSRWIPYEYGRVKDSSPYSLNAACWIDTGVTTSGLPEYFLLSPITTDNQEISAWLRSERAAWQNAHPGCSPTLAGDPNDVDKKPTPGEAQLVSRESIDDALAMFYDGLPNKMAVSKPLQYKKQD